MKFSASPFRLSRRHAWCVWALALMAPFAVRAEDGALVKYEVLHSFDGHDGQYPLHSLIMGKDGLVHGAALTSFKITRAGEFTVVNAFDKRHLGWRAVGLVQAGDGQYYGAAYMGGDLKSGTAYRMTPKGKVTLLHTFDGFATEGGNPWAPFLLASDGAFYSTTSDSDNGSCGSLFRMTPAGELTVLHQFTLAPDNGCGADTWALMQATDGHIYGVTARGGATNSGAIYRWTSGGVWELLYSFQQAGLPGWQPNSGLVQAADGALYGTTYDGGANGNGTFYRLDPETRTVSVVKAFGSGRTDPRQPRGELLLARDGNFYGTTVYGGEHESGAVYRVTTAGEMTTIFSFPDQSKKLGYMPFAGLVEGRDGEFFGTTHYSGEFNYGTIFRLTLK